jgi:hypothetical protein
MKTSAPGRQLACVALRLYAPMISVPAWDSFGQVKAYVTRNAPTVPHPHGTQELFCGHGCCVHVRRPQSQLSTSTRT